LLQAGVWAVAQGVEPVYFRVNTLSLENGAAIDEVTISGPPTPPPGFQLERQAAALPTPDLAAGINVLTVPAFNWVFGCSAVSGAMIAGYYDRSGWPNIYVGPTNGGVMPLNNSSWPTWSDGSDTYPNCPLIASKNGVDGRTSRGSIDDYWVEYGSATSDPYLRNGWTPHTWGEAIGDYMKTSQSAFGNTDGSTTFYNYTSSSSRLTCDVMAAQNLPDGTLGRKLFYQARGYTVTDCYSQNTDNTISGGFSFAQFKAEIDAGRPVFLNLQGHSVVGVGYDDATNLVYIHDTWDYNNHTMTWGASYSGMGLLSVSIVNLSAVNAPNPPSGLTATGVSASQINLAWTDNSTNETGFRVERKTGAAGTWSQIGSLGANIRTYSNTGLAAGTTYYYRVRAYHASGNSAYSNEAMAATTSAALPRAPSGLTMSVIASTQINLAWTDNSTNETGFRVERKTGAAGTWSQIASLGVNVRTFSNTGLAAGTTYYYRVRAYNASGNSGYSNEVMAATPSLLPTAPSGLTATTNSATQITLAWVDNSTNETGFLVDRKTGASGAWSQIASLGANVRTFSNTGLAASTTYYYRVRATNGNGNSAYSNEAGATTSAAACSSGTTPIGVGSSATGTLATTDCSSTVRTGRYYDNFTFAATAGTRYTITLNAAAFDAYLYLLGSTGQTLAFDDDGNGGTNAKIVFSPTTSGTLTIHASSYSQGEVGGYTVAVAQSSGACSSSTTAIGVGSSANGALAATDCISVVRMGSYYDNFTFAAKAGIKYTITLTSSAYDTYLYLRNSTGQTLAYDDDGNGGTNAKLIYTPTASGTLTIHATSYDTGATGNYTVSLRKSK
jgi:fibronectin type 3 domain-containing protein